ncbi:MAG: nodulation protein NfeD [Vicinamibacterales bacterium]
MKAPARRMLALALLLPLAALVCAQSAEERPLVYAAEVEALIHPVSAEFMVQTMERADEDGASAVVFTLRTPGGLVDSTRTIVTRMLASKTPVIVFVAPAGERAASAGFLITIAADVAAMAPGTNIGAAHPVSGGGEQMNETMSKKAAEDVAAYARNLAARRSRNVELADQAVKESKAFTDAEALAARPPLIDIVAADLGELLEKLDGRQVSRFDGKVVTLHLENARVVPVEMSWRQRVLSAIAHPNIAYILLSLGMLGLTIELWNPGSILPGVAGGICLLLAFFVFQVLPVNYVGLLLLFFGLMLLILEVKVASFGLLAAGGILSLVLGALILVDSPMPELRVSLSVILPVAVSVALITLFLVRLAVQSQLRRSITGTSGMVGESGRALSAIAPDRPGRVATHGEIWNAVSNEEIHAGDPILVSAVDGLTLTVRRDPGRPLPAPETTGHMEGS